ncbi:MAG TPA: hypothetical protein VH479_21750, partial [Acidimicrobiales bacterium]
MGTSSADAFALGRYADDGLALVATLESDSDSVTGAVSALRASASPLVPSLGDVDAVLAGLVGDWRHLDEFAGDVAAAFFTANPELGGRRRRAGTVLRMSDDAVLASGHVGYADRDGAVAAARRLAADVEAALDRGRAPAGDVRALAARAERGRSDPAFSVAFVTGLGVRRMVALPALIRTAGPTGAAGGGPGWARQLLAPFTAVLTTAMDTRAARAAGDRLSDAWVDELAAFQQDGPDGVPTDNDLSLLTRFSALPVDVLVEVAGVQLDDLLAFDEMPWSLHESGDPWGIGGSTTEVNILAALGADDDASLGWLTSDRPGAATNLERLLRYDPSTHDPTLGAALAQVVANGLQHLDRDRAGALFEIAVDTVGDQGTVHFGEQMLPVLAAGARTHRDRLAARADEVLTGTQGRPDRDLTRSVSEAHDFLRTVMA